MCSKSSCSEPFVKVETNRIDNNVTLLRVISQRDRVMPPGVPTDPAYDKTQFNATNGYKIGISSQPRWSPADLKLFIRGVSTISDYRVVGLSNVHVGGVIDAIRQFNARVSSSVVCSCAGTVPQNQAIGDGWKNPIGC